MNVCGGHERSISMAGLRGALPPQVELIPGPGCPVCVCPEEDIYAAIQLARRADVTVAAFGDMLRVPCNAPKAEPRSLEQAKAAGGDVRPVSSPEEVRVIAESMPGREVVFFAAGFETTTAPVAGLIAQGLPPNLSVLLSGRLTWPAVAMLLEGELPGFNALIAPGHVATVMGPEEWSFVAEKHEIPAAVAGFNSESGDWRYSMIMPDGSLFGETGGVNAESVDFCIGCHATRSKYDHLFFLPEELRLKPIEIGQ